PGTYRLRVFPIAAPLAGLPWGLAATVIRGNTKAEMDAYLEGQSTAAVNEEFPITIRVSNHSYVASAVLADLISPPPGVTPLYITSTRLDGIHMRFTAALGGVTLGNLPPSFSRFATFWFRATTPGTKTFLIRASSENGGERILTKNVQVTSVTNLVQTAMGMTPSAPIVAPGGKFSITDTVQNTGLSPTSSSSTRYYFSLDATKSADDILLSGTHSVPGLDPGASHTATVAVTIPTGAPLGNYFVLVCADDKAVISESNEADNCIASPGAIATVARPDLAATTVTSNPSAPVRAPGTTFSVSDTVQNFGPVPSGSSATRYYLSLNAVKGVGDTLLSGSRGVPGLAAGASHSGTVTLTIPAGTLLNSYFLLACADDPNTVVESGDGNNCVATATATVTVTRPDLVESTMSPPPATKQRGTGFPVSGTVQNLGAVPSGASATRYYLSLDLVKSTNDTMLTGSRSVPGLAAGGSHSATVTVTIPAATAPNTYFLLACADNTNVVIETNETNNCTPSSTTVTITP
ncbi:MAG: CARDB domain-containing protein, partial [Candidatus Rokuibacteriota bacterium]